MNQMKRIGALALALVMALTALTACGGKGSGSGDTSQGAAIDLSKITDPCLTISGLAGDTVVAKLGSGSEITAQQLLYWFNRTGSLDNALDVAAFHCTLRLMAQQENLTPDPSIAQEMEQEYASLIEEAGDENLVNHVLWAQMLSKDMLAYFNESGDLFSQLADLYYGEDSDNYPTDAEVMAWLEEGGYFKVKHILLMTQDQMTGVPLDEAAVAEKKSTADDLLAQLRAADDPMALFDQLMNEHSEDGGLQTNPDGYTFSAKDSLVGGFREATLALEPGEISDIVETDYGYHILLRLPIDPADYRDKLISDRFGVRATQFQEEQGLEKTAEFDKLDPTAIINQMRALQTAVYQEMAAIDSQNSGDSSGASSAGGSQS